jgi:COP9 signalosome complex subunit 2
MHPTYSVLSAKKEDNPEEALKEFRAIVDQEKEQGDWYVPLR